MHKYLTIFKMIQDDHFFPSSHISPKSSIDVVHTPQEILKPKNADFFQIWRRNGLGDIPVRMYENITILRMIRGDQFFLPKSIISHKSLSEVDQKKYLSHKC